MALTNSSDAVAADAGASDGAIIVTARRVEERLQDVPISITVLNQEQIDDRNIVQGSDLAIYTPSLTVNQRFGAETSSFSIRGFLQEANTAPSVGVYFAEVTTPRSLGSTVAGSNLPIGSFMDLENTQVLKGPQGTLFGRNTTGGAVILVPKKPTDRLEGYVEASAGDYSMWRGQAVLNVPLSDTFKVRLDFDRMKRDGYMKNTSGVGPKALNDTDYYYARLSILANLTPNLENYTVAHYSNSDTNGFGAHIFMCDQNPYDAGSAPLAPIFAPLACAQIARQAARGDGPLTVENALDNPFFKIREWQVINNTTWEASDNLTVKNIASYTQYQADINYDLGGMNFNFMDLGLPYSIPITATRIVGTPPYHSADQWALTEELQLQGKSDNGRLSWQAGAYFELSKSPNWNQSYANLFLSCPNDTLLNLQCFDPIGYGFSAISAARVKANFHNKALYAQATYDITDKFALTGGIRYTWDRTVGESESFRVYFPLPAVPQFVCGDRLRLTEPDGSPLVISNPAQCYEAFTAKSSKPTWLINLDYKPNSDILIYAKWARGYRAGAVALNNFGNEVWNPEKLDSYEVGLKATMRGAVSGYFNAAAFYNDFTNQQIVTTTQDKATGAPGGNAIVNAGSSTIWGFEVDSSVTFFDSLNFNVGYTFLHTRIKKLTLPVSPIFIYNPLAQAGDPLPQVPKHRLNVSVKYTLPLDESIGKISLGATYVYTGKQFFNRNSPIGFQDLPATNLLNFNVKWDELMGQPIDLSFFLTNATNEKIPVVYSGSWASYGEEDAQYAAPRMWGVRVRYSFGQ